VRVAVPNKEGRLKPGMFVTAAVRTPMGRYGQIGTPSEPKVEAKETVQAASGDYPLDYCVVTGAKIGTMGEPIVVKYEGRTIKFCCDACPPQFKADPAKYLKIIDEAAAKLKQGGENAHWVEGYACPMHPDQLQPQGGTCTICDCGMQTVKWRVEKLPSISETSVIDTGTRQIVYVEAEPGVYDAREVTLGQRTGAYFPVVRGLALGERVVARGSFLIDAEARLNPAAAATFSGAAAGPQTQPSAPEGQKKAEHQH